jgi:hypothetical protein
VVPEGEIVLESTPNGAAGVFYEEWQKANETARRQSINAIEFQSQEKPTEEKT